MLGKKSWYILLYLLLKQLSISIETKAMQRSRDLLAVTYAEFDNHAGPQLRYSYPSDVINKETFEPIADYVILGKHLCERVITVRLEKWQLLSYPIAIENNKYDRNTLSFAFGFVLSFGAKSGEYGKVLKNIGSFFQDLEVKNIYFVVLKTRNHS